MLVVGLLGFVGIGLVGEFFNEVEWRDKSDDIFIVVLAIWAAIWFFSGRNRYKFSWLPTVLLAITAVVKVSTFFYEFDDQVARGDEFGLMVPLLVLTIICVILTFQTQRRNRVTALAPEQQMMPPGD